MKALLLCFFVYFSHAIEVKEKLKLSSGYEIPVVGLGTSAIKKEELEGAIANTLENCYRHFDTAYLYKNEALIGKALKKWFDQGGKRQDVFITSKLPPQANRPENVEKYLKLSLEELQLEYVDMYLIHLPFGLKEGQNISFGGQGNPIILEDDVDHVALWKEMEKQVKAGRAKSIGLSNFNETQILNIYNNAEIKPSNLQIESHAYLQQKKLREFCKEKNIVVTAYAPLGSMVARKIKHTGTEKNLQPLIENSIVNELAQKYKKSPAQILLRHLIQDGLVVIPKSSNPTRQKENIEIFDFELSAEDVKKMDTLDVGEKGRVFDFLSSFKNVEKNSQYPFRESTKQNVV